MYYEDYDIVYLLWEDYDVRNSDNKVGKVVELFFGNYVIGFFGLDFVVVKCNNVREEGMFFFFGFNFR